MSNRAQKSYSAQRAGGAAQEDPVCVQKVPEGQGAEHPSLGGDPFESSFVKFKLHRMVGFLQKPRFTTLTFDGRKWVVPV